MGVDSKIFRTSFRHPFMLHFIFTIVHISHHSYDPLLSPKLQKLTTYILTHESLWQNQ